MSFLETWQKKQSGNSIDYLKMYAEGKDIVIVGGGDTGVDCIATSLRQVRRSFIQLNLLCVIIFVKWRIYLLAQLKSQGVVNFVVDSKLGNLCQLLSLIHMEGWREWFWSFFLGSTLYGSY